jgi:hypothetical protein
MLIYRMSVSVEGEIVRAASVSPTDALRTV